MPSFTKPFILPGLLSADVLGKPEVKNIQNGRKVHLYVPPPLAPGNSNSNDREGEQRGSQFLKTNGSRNPSHTSSSVSLNRAPEIQSSTAADVYPSPSRLRVSRPSSLVTRGCKDVPLTSKGQISPVYRPPSPPTSDLPIPGEDTDMHFRIDPQDVRKKHPAAKALFEKVFFKYFVPATHTHLFRTTFVSVHATLMPISGRFWSSRAVVSFLGMLTLMISSRQSKTRKLGSPIGRPI